MKRLCFLSVLLMLAIGYVADEARADSIVNGGFEEEPDLGGASTWAIYDSITGWTTSSGPGIEIQSGGVAGAPYEGTQLVELDSTANSAMYQDVATDAGLSYVLSFFYSPRPDVVASSNGIQVWWNNLLLDTITAAGAAGTVWTEYTYIVTGAVGTSTRLEFVADGTSNSYGGYLDAVSLEASPVPEPGTFALLGLGMLTLLLVRRRKLASAS